MAKVFKSYRDASKTNWGSTEEEKDFIGRDAVQLGAILRIADATEKMAGNYTALQVDRDMYKRWYEQECENTAKLNKQNAGLRGVITKLKQSAAK